MTDLEDFNRYPEMYRIVDCINSGCDNAGTIAVQVDDWDWELEQCRFCYEYPTSAFNGVNYEGT